MIYRYPQEVHDFVRENCTKMRDAELAEACNAALGTEFTKSSMKAFRGNHKYNNNLGKLNSEEYWKIQTKWPRELKDFIRNNTWHVSSEEMSRMVKAEFGIDMTPEQVKGFRARHHISNGNTGWFQKNHPPANKGKKITEYMSPEAVEKVRKTAFKKGSRPPNEMPVGTEIVNKYSDGYRIRKVSMNGRQNERWKFVHRLVWEEHNGPIPEGGCIVFRDGDKMNCNIENLAMLTHAELSVMNKRGYFSDSPEVTDVGITLAKIRKAVTEAEKRRRTKNQNS